jgi:hypothetical protein
MPYQPPDGNERGRFLRQIPRRKGRQRGQWQTKAPGIQKVPGGWLFLFFFACAEKKEVQEERVARFEDSDLKRSSQCGEVQCGQVLGAKWKDAWRLKSRLCPQIQSPGASQN